RRVLSSAGSVLRAAAAVPPHAAAAARARRARPRLLDRGDLAHARHLTGDGAQPPPRDLPPARRALARRGGRARARARSRLNLTQACQVEPLPAWAPWLWWGPSRSCTRSRTS